MKISSSTIFWLLSIVCALILGYSLSEYLRDRDLSEKREELKFKEDTLRLEYKLDSLHTTHSCWSNKRVKPIPRYQKKKDKDSDEINLAELLKDK